MGTSYSIDEGPGWISLDGRRFELKEGPLNGLEDAITNFTAWELYSSLNSRVESCHLYESQEGNYLCKGRVKGADLNKYNALNALMLRCASLSSIDVKYPGVRPKPISVSVAEGSLEILMEFRLPPKPKVNDGTFYLQ
jgi:hypothetical protein